MTKETLTVNPKTVRAKRSDTFVPTEAQRALVAMGTACGMPQREIIKKIINPHTKKPIAMVTLHRVFRDELDDCDAATSALVAQNMFRYASTKNNQAVIAGKFWLTHKAGWKPAVAEAADNGKITIEVVNRLDE